MAEAALATTSTAPASPPPAPSPAPSPASFDKSSGYSAPPLQSRPGAIPREQYERLPEAERANYAQIRGANGTEFVARSNLEVSPADGKPPPGGPGDFTRDAASVAPDGRLQIGDMLLSQDDIKSLMTEKAARDLRATQVPPRAEDYAATLPQNFKLPEGTEWQFNEADPALNDIRQLAKRSGWSQDDFSNVLAVYAAKEVSAENLIRAAARAEMDKLGPAAAQRLSAVETFIRGIAGDQLGGALRQMILTANHVKGWEAIIQRMVGQGAASYSQAHRDVPAQPGRVSEEEFGRMSHAQRLDYARGFDQSQFRNGR
jgi:hypothetical protein